MWSDSFLITKKYHNNSFHLVILEDSIDFQLINFTTASSMKVKYLQILWMDGFFRRLRTSSGAIEIWWPTEIGWSPVSHYFIMHEFNLIWFWQECTSLLCWQPLFFCNICTTILIPDPLVWIHFIFLHSK